MSLWTWTELTAAVHVADQTGPEIRGVSIDSRTVAEGDLFVALRGSAPPPFHSSGGAGRDGHEFVQAAFAAGAAGALVHQLTAPEAGKSMSVGTGTAAAPCILVPDTFEGLWAIARAARRRADARVVAMTGSSGKTTLRHLVEALFRVVGNGHTSTGSLNNHWGVPLSMARMPRATTRAAFEVGMNHPGELAPLAKLVEPEIAVVLNVLPVHLEQFTDGIAGIRREKLSIREGLLPGGTLLVPEALGERGPHVIVYDGAGSPVRLIDDRESRLVFDYRGTRLSLRAPDAGHHHVQTMRAALTIGALLDLPADAAETAWAHLGPLAGRGALTRVGGVTICDDSYNANPVSMAHALEALRSREGGRRIAVLGEILELGGEAPTFYDSLADATAGLSGVITVGDGLAEFPAHAPRWKHVSSVAELPPETFAEELQPGDQVLVKGSNRVFWVHQWTQRLIEALERRGG